MNKYAIGNNIQSLLESHNMTQRQLVDAINVTEASVCRWIKGNRMPTAYALYRISCLFGVTVDSLLERIDDMPHEIRALNLGQAYNSRDYVIETRQTGDTQAFVIKRRR